MKYFFSSIIFFTVFTTSLLNKIDTNSYSNLEQVIQRYINLTLTIDFENKILKGFTNITFDVLANSARYVILDTKDLKIKNITNNESKVLRSLYNTKSQDDPKGNPLIIDLGKIVPQGKNFSVLIEYETMPNAPVLHWIDKEHIEGNNFPLVYSSCKSINCRNLLPCQDSPSAKVDLYAKLRVLNPMKALFSGISYTTLRDDDYGVYTFKSNNKIPTYMFSLIAGDFGITQIGSKTAVWSNTYLTQIISEQFNNSEFHLNKIEDYLTIFPEKYQYIVSMPYAFAWKYSDNPNLLLWSRSINPVNDSSSLMNNFAHSWFGHFITHINWDNIWLAEGFSTFIERKVLKSIYGEDLFNLNALKGDKEMCRFISEMGENNNITSLHPDTSMIDNDYYINIIAKEKGFQFLLYLENLTGEEMFRKILIKYINTFKNQSIDYNDFKNLFETSIPHMFPIERASSILKSVDWNSWIFKPGHPIIKNQFISKLAEKAKNYSDLFFNISIKNTFNLGDEDFKRFDYHTKLFFLDILHERIKDINQTIYLNLRDTLELSKYEDSEILYSWILLSLKLREKEIIPILDDFLSIHGRYDFLINLYKEYYNMDKYFALRCFNSNKEFYHPKILKDLSNIFTEIETKY